MASKLRSFVNFFRLLTVEPISFLNIFLFVFKSLPLDQMIQDKLCLHQHNMTPNYCQALPTMKAEDDVYSMKSTILGDVTTFKLYSNILITLPSFFVAMFIGPFIDRYPPAKKQLLIIASFVSLTEGIILCVNSYFFTINVYYLLIAQVVSALCGGPLVILSSVWAYLSSVTPPHLRPLRMIIIEIFVVAGPPTGQAIGGHLLMLKTPFLGHEPRNFTALFLICCACSILMLLNALLLVDEPKDKRLFKKFFPAPAETINDEKDRVPQKVIVKKDKLASSDKEVSPIKLLFDVNNVKEMFRTFLKPRRHNVRFHLILLIIASMTILLAYIGPAVFLYQYVEKVFNWNSSQYSNYTTVTSTINILSMFTLAPLVLKVFKMSDLHVALLSIHFFLIQNIIRILSSKIWSFYAAMPFYLINSLSMVGIRSYLTNIVERNELGRIFSLMSALDASLPVISSLVFAPIFRLTIDSHPNLSFVPICVNLAIGIVCLYIVSYQSKETLRNVTRDRQAVSGAVCDINGAKTPVAHPDLETIA